MANDMADRDDLQGINVLLVEDNYLVGRSIRIVLEQYGCRVHGPVATVEDSRRAVDDEDFDIAVLDINIVGGTSVSVAEALLTRSCPVVFLTGYNSPGLLPANLKHVRRLIKPVRGEMLRNALAGEIARAADGES